MGTLRINKSAVDRLAPGAKDAFWWDAELKGFGVKVTPQGRRIYLVNYRMPGKRKSDRYTIGPHGSPWTADQARREAAKQLLLVSQGIDPNASKRLKRAETTDYSFEAYADRFVEQYLRIHWPGSTDRAESVLRKHAKPFFKRRDIREIARRDCAAFIDSLSHIEATARKAAEVVGKMFRWAEDRGDIERSPMDRVPRPKPSPGRERVLDDCELKAIWQAATKLNHPYGRLVQMLMLMGQRRGELGGMRWVEVDFDRMLWEVPSDRTKSKRGNVVPLTPMMTDLLHATPDIGSLVFSVSGENQIGNHSKLKTLLDAKVAEVAAEAELRIAPWTLHDLRRTAATGLQRLGVSSDMIEVIQGRTRKLGAGQRYQRYDYFEEKRAALAKWDAHIQSVLTSN